jgi:hypothetical protein
MEATLYLEIKEYSMWRIFETKVFRRVLRYDREEIKEVWNKLCIEGLNSPCSFSISFF